MSDNAKFRWFFSLSIVIALFICFYSPAISWAGQLEDAKEVVRKNPNSSAAHYNLGLDNGNSAQYPDAITSYKVWRGFSHEN
tara:strand:- start:294 stop:539 length:246 start_codon:yes stop_codon:yes gene_type:complete